MVLCCRNWHDCQCCGALLQKLARPSVLWFFVAETGMTVSVVVLCYRNSQNASISTSLIASRSTTTRRRRSVTTVAVCCGVSSDRVSSAKVTHNNSTKYVHHSSSCSRNCRFTVYTSWLTRLFGVTYYVFMYMYKYISHTYC